VRAGTDPQLTLPPDRRSVRFLPHQFIWRPLGRLYKAIANDSDLIKTTLQHIKSVLSGIFTHAKNEGAFDGVNPVQDAHIPSNTREPRETYAYNLVQIRRLLEFLPLLPRAAVATAADAGLREGELRGLEWPDYTGDALNVCRSVWKSIVNKPKTPVSAKPVPVIRQLAEILDEYRDSVGQPSSGVMFHTGDGRPIDLDKLAQRVIRPVAEATGIGWYGWHGFRRGIASNLYELGADEKVVQRHAKAHVTKERYIKAFDPTVVAAMKKAGSDFGRLGPECTSSAPDELRTRDKLLKTNAGEVAEWLKAAVC
jgi:integrase